jgi:hypothetical protein
MDCEPDGKAFRRMNATHLLLPGAPYQVVLRNSRMNQLAFRLWVERFNKLGIDGLICRPHAGRPRKPAPDELANDILPVVDDASLANHTHRTVTRLCGWLREEKQLDLFFRTLVRYLHEHN